MITTENLHSAADKVGMHTTYAENSLEEGALIEFSENAVFHPPLDKLAVAYGIMIGIRAARDHDLEWLRSKLTDESYLRDERMVVIKLIEEYKG